MTISEEKESDTTTTRAYSLDAFVPQKKLPTNLIRLKNFFLFLFSFFQKLHIEHHLVFWKFFIVFSTVFLLRHQSFLHHHAYQNDTHFISVCALVLVYFSLLVIQTWRKTSSFVISFIIDSMLIILLCFFKQLLASFFISLAFPFFYLFGANQAKWMTASFIWWSFALGTTFLYMNSEFSLFANILIFMMAITIFLKSILTIELKKIHHLPKAEDVKHQAVLEERYRLARDIHDGLGAYISSIIIQSEYIGHLVKDEKARAEIDELHNMAEESMYELRRSLTMMRSEFELVPSLEDYCIQFESRHRIKTHLNVSLTQLFELPNETQLTIFRILQEALHNVVKHASAQNVYLSLETGPDAIQMIVRDDGKGFDMSKTVKHHYGLQNMQDRAKKIQGEITIQSTIGQGTKVSLLLNQPKTTLRKP